MSTDGWMNKEVVIYIKTMEYYSTIKNEEILPFATTWIDLEDIKWNKSEIQMLYDLPHIWNLKKKNKKTPNS